MDKNLRQEPPETSQHTPEMRAKTMVLGITGATGFLGSYLVDYFRRMGGCRIRAMTRTLPADVQTADGVEWLQGDLNSMADCRALVQGVDVLVHLAHAHNPLTSNGNLTTDATMSLIPTLQLLEAVRAAGTKPHVIYASSGGAVYGRTPGSARRPFRESDPCMPITAYGIQKLTCEHYLRMAAEEGWLTASVLRISNPYGTLLSPARRQGLIGIVFHQLTNARPIQVFGNPDNMRDYIHLEDMADAFLRVLTPREPYAVFNIGSGRAHSVTEVLDLIEEVSGRPIVREYVEVPEANAYLVPWLVLDVERARRQLDWSPKFSLRTGLTMLFHKCEGSLPREIRRAA